MLLAAAVASTHGPIADDHMGEAAAMCLAVLVAGGAAAGTLPSLGRLLPARPRPLDAPCPSAPSARRVGSVPWARGDPAVLQVFRR